LALMKAGHQVTVLDAGARLEPDRQHILDGLRTSEVAEWDPESIAAIKAGTGAEAGGAVRKLSYGSDFPYRDAARLTPIAARRATTVSSLASGGLSNVWGAAMLPYRSDDIADWPLRAEELTPAYEALLRYVPLAARRDALEELFPLYTDTFAPLTSSEQAERLLCRMEAHKASLTRAGFAWGASRLAVHRGCVYCGLCMYGCPRDVIYRSPHSLESVEYIRNVLIERVVEHGSTVTLSGTDLSTRSTCRFEADRVFFACGVFQTARIMLRSLEAGTRPLTMRDSQYFLLPILGLTGATSAATEKLHTLAQVFVEVEDAGISPHRSHLQLYTYNDLFASAIERRLGRFEPLTRPLVTRTLNRLMAIQGYLHSADSTTASASLDGDRLIVTGHDGPEASRRVWRLARKLVRHASQLGFVPLLPLLDIGDFGRGSHVGGTLPMRARPGALESDRYGRPYGFSRVHVVDASVLPSIPATTITLSVMANAHRIASVPYDG
jgi:choline dehydrogenase-like flavoprotein